MTEKQKKLFQLQLKMVQYNHLAIMCP
jgi:hypothetical protein